MDNLFEVFLKISEIESVYVKGRGSVIIEEDSASMKNECLRMKKLLSNKKQVILYGPPGTGKTYVASNFIKSNTSDQIYNEKQTIPYDSSKKDDTFVTSNLIKSDTSDQTTKEKISIDRKFFFYGSKLTYPKIQELWNKSESTLDINSNMHRKETIDIIKAGDMLFIYAASPRKKVIGIAEFIQKELQWDGKLIFRIKNLKQMRNGPTLEDLRNDSILSKSEPIINELKGNLNPINKDAALRLLKLSKVSLDNSNVENIIEPEVVQNHEFSKVEKIAEPEISKNHELITYYEFITFHPSFSYEDFIEGLRPLNNDDGQISYKVDEGLFKRYSRFAFNALMAKAEIEKEWGQMENIPQLTVEEKEKAKKAAGEVSFYLVIDEINRGDISRIFGELITLLESDKRLTADNELIITLPYSKTKFAVSPNLYLIGTMNTADKSIALIDIALRRRFGFIEMMPDYSVLEEKLVNEDKDIKEVFDLSIQALKKVNENILKTYDRDHQIGHSYLLKLKDSKSRNDAIEDFRFIWYYEILPLMQEYFYDAPAKLKQVLGNEFIVVENRSFSFIDNLEGEEFIKTIQRVVNSEKRQNEIGD
ncbi:AAA domain [anaerobic digester metagenome]